MGAESGVQGGDDGGSEVGAGNGGLTKSGAKRKRGAGDPPQADNRDEQGAGAGSNALQTYVQILGTDTGDTCPCVMVVAQNCKYLFNVGDGLQRFCTQHGVRLIRLQHIFLTRLHADAIGGLLGMYLTLADTGVKRVVVHGAPGTSRFLSAGQSFCENRLDSELVSEELKLDFPSPFVDGNMTVQPCVAWPELDRNQPDQDAMVVGDQGQGTGTEAESGKKRHKENRGPCAVSYLLRFPDVQGKFDVAKAKQLGIPPGPLFARLKAGQAVQLPGEGGRTIKPSECVEPGTKGSCVAIIDCPTTGHVASLVASLGASSGGAEAGAAFACSFMVHFAPMEVLLDPRYFQCVHALSLAGVVHSVVNAAVCPQRCIFPSHAVIVSHMRALRPSAFPLLAGMPGSSVGIGGGEVAALDGLKEAWGNAAGHVVAGDVLQRFGLTPLRFAGFDTSAVDEIEQPPAEQPAGEDQEGRGEGPGQADAPEDIPALIRSIGRDACEVVMLGTAASMPGKYRNVSGIYLDLPRRGGMLLDCGEGSLGQLTRMYGREAMQGVLMGLKCVWISHMHADHHLGLLRVMSARSAAVRASGGHAGPPLTVIGPPPLSKWLRTYASFDPCEYELIHNARLHAGNEWVGCGPREVLKGLLAEQLGVDIVTAPVRHSCRDACAVIVSAPGPVEGTPLWKIAYSGDTRPCQALVDAGMDATLLIHEATLDSPLLEDAKAKQHSTTGEALSIGRRMRAYRTLLTHFSQRYPKVPPLEEIALDGAAAVAFDLMRVNLADLPTLPTIMAPLVKLAAEQGWMDP